MKHHKITCREDLERIMTLPYEKDSIFEVLETGEEINLSDFLYNADWDNFGEITIQHI